MGMVADCDGFPFVNACTRAPARKCVTSMFYKGACAHVHARWVHTCAVDLGAAYACTVSEEAHAIGGGEGSTQAHARTHTYA